MHYIIWLSSKGSKEIYSITDSKEVAKYYYEELNKWYKKEGGKARAYITECEDAKTYFHHEINLKTCNSMKHIYILYFHYENEEIIKAWSREVWSTMKGACRYGERIYRKYGHKYRVIKTYVNPDTKIIF